MSKADEMLINFFERKEETYDKEKLEYIEYRTNYNWLKNDSVKFYLKSKNIEINATINKEMLQAINEKVKELGWNE